MAAEAHRAPLAEADWQATGWTRRWTARITAVIFRAGRSGRNVSTSFLTQARGEGERLCVLSQQVEVLNSMSATTGKIGWKKSSTIDTYCMDDKDAVANYLKFETRTAASRLPVFGCARGV
eukprot:5734875-Pleurochrysis_carterae.AAC.1